jgi:hypothetical protein
VALEASFGKFKFIDFLFQNKCHHLDNKLMKIKVACDVAENKKNDAKKSLQRLEQRVVQQKKVVSDHVTKALKLTKERIETKR